MLLSVAQLYIVHNNLYSETRYSKIIMKALEHKARQEQFKRKKGWQSVNYLLIALPLLRSLLDGSESLSLEDDCERLRCRELGNLLFLSRSLEREESELESEPESEPDESESESEVEVESESESESESDFEEL